MANPYLIAWFVNLFHPGVVDEWQFDSGKGYAFIDTSMPWEDAADTCNDLGLDMVTPTSHSELGFLVEAAYNGKDNKGALNSWFWIGAYNTEVDSSVSAWQVSRGYYWNQWNWENGESWGYHDFDGQMESGGWGYDNHGAAIVITDIGTAASTRWGSYWRVAPANNYYKVVCETP